MARPMDLAPPTPRDIMIYRYQHGANVGSVFVLERWLGSMYEEDTNGSSELEAVKRSLQTRGLERTKARWEAHWLAGLTEGDLLWLRDVARCNSIRLPIGYFTLGPSFCLGTPFEGDMANVYINAWNIVKRIVEKCYDYGIGVLIDFHAVPGGANPASHSGTESGRAELWESMHYRALARDCLAFIAQEVTHHELSGVIGLELCNEAIRDAPGIDEFCDEVIEITAAINPSLPVYISDGWDLSRALDYALLKNRVPVPIGGNPVIVDTHRHYTSPESKSMSPESIIEQIHGELSELETRQGDVFNRKSAVDAYVGEYSCAMDTQTWNRVDASQRLRLTKTFGQEQSRRWTAKASGSAFWTFKTDATDSSDFGFKDQVNTGAIPAPAWLTIPRDQVSSAIDQAENQRTHLGKKALTDHSGYWASTSPETVLGLHRFTRGWDIGYSDAKHFFGAMAHGFLPGGGNGGDKIGAVDLWTRKRMVEADEFDQQSGWEWEHGFRKGISDFYAAVGLT